MRTRKLLRRPNWDYSCDATYMITIVTHQRRNYFGEITETGMILSEIGKIAHDCWFAIPNYYPHVKLGAGIVMPNHIHGIIHYSRPQIEKPNDGLYFGPESKSLSMVIRGYKIGVSSLLKKEGMIFKWQARFHDAILAGENAIETATNYIINNPQRHLEKRLP